MKRDILGLALAGGESERLGEDKVLLSFHGKRTQLDYTLSLLNRFCSKIALSGRENQRDQRKNEYGAAFILDAKGVPGPMSGVLAGLRSSLGWPVLAIACDMPLIDASLVLRLLSQRNPEKRATCFIAGDGKPEPMLTIYEPSAMEELDRLSDSGDFSLRHFLETSDVERVLCKQPQLLASVNTLEEVSRVKELLAKESQ